MNIIRVDSAEEQYAYLVSTYGSATTWAVDSQVWGTGPDGEMIELATVRLGTGESVEVRFGAVSDDDAIESAESSVEWLDKVLEAASQFSSNNPPHHPGTTARFPVPAAGYANAITVPMNVIATDGSKTGLYAPPRIVALTWSTLEPVGVGESPGFDPEFWPPERLSDWPLPQLAGVSPEQLQALIQRFSAVWHRVLQAWFGNEYPWLQQDVQAATELRHLLDASTMDACYQRLNPVFWQWLHRFMEE